MYIMLNKYVKKKKNRTFIFTACRVYLYISVYMIRFYSNETVKSSWSDSQIGLGTESNRYQHGTGTYVTGMY